MWYYWIIVQLIYPLFQFTATFALTLRLVDLIATATDFEISMGFKTLWRAHFWQSKYWMIIEKKKNYFIIIAIDLKAKYIIIHVYLNLTNFKQDTILAVYSLKLQVSIMFPSFRVCFLVLKKKVWEKWFSLIFI